MKIVNRHANGRFDLLISGHQSVNHSREVISILSGKYKRFRFVHSVGYNKKCLTKIVKGCIFGNPLVRTFNFDAKFENLMMSARLQQ